MKSSRAKLKDRNSRPTAVPLLHTSSAPSEKKFCQLAAVGTPTTRFKKEGMGIK